MTERSPLREPMLWLVIALPLASVVAGVGLVITAVRSGGDDVGIDPVQRMAQVQQSELGPDARATAMQLSAVLRLQPGRIEVYPAHGEFPRDQPLRLRLVHPTDAALDRAAELLPDALGWHADGDFSAAHDWRVQLAPADGHWRVQGRLQAGQQAVNLRPALAGR